MKASIQFYAKVITLAVRNIVKE